MESVMTLYNKEGYYIKDTYTYIARRSLGNNLTGIENLCKGARCRNNYMADVIKNSAERFKQIENVLSNAYIVDMMENYGRDLYTDKIMSSMSVLLETYGEMETLISGIIQEENMEMFGF
jgi:hypothetical protein